MMKLDSRCVVLLAALSVAGCTSGRLGAPAGEVVRYMARPPASTVPAPADGTYALFQNPDKPPLFVFDLRAGQPVGFRRGEEGGLDAVVGDQPPFPLDNGSRYSWKRQVAANSSAADSAGGSVQTVDRAAQAKVALDAAERDMARSQLRYDAATRRLESARQNLAAATSQEAQ